MNPLLPYSKQYLQFLMKIHFQYSDLIDSEKFQLRKILVGNKQFYATHRNDVGKVSNPFRMLLKPDAKLPTR